MTVAGRIINEAVLSNSKGIYCAGIVHNPAFLSVDIRQTVAVSIEIIEIHKCFTYLCLLF